MLSFSIVYCSVFIESLINICYTCFKSILYYEYDVLKTGGYNEFVEEIYKNKKRKRSKNK